MWMITQTARLLPLLILSRSARVKNLIAFVDLTEIAAETLFIECLWSIRALSRLSHFDSTY